MSNKQTQYAYHYLENDAEVMHRLIAEGTLSKLSERDESEALDAWLDANNQTRKLVLCSGPSDRPHREMPTELRIWKVFGTFAGKVWMYRFLVPGDKIPKDATHGWWSEGNEAAAVKLALDNPAIDPYGSVRAWSIKDNFLDPSAYKVAKHDHLLVFKCK